MGMFSACPVCRSKYCCQCECVKKRYEPLRAFVQYVAEHGAYGDPEGWRDKAQKLLEDFKHGNN